MLARKSGRWNRGLRTLPRSSPPLDPRIMTKGALAMRSTLRPLCLSAALMGSGILLSPASPARADEPTAIGGETSKSDVTSLDLLEGLRTGVVSVEAEGT